MGERLEFTLRMWDGIRGVSDTRVNLDPDNGYAGYVEKKLAVTLSRDKIGKEGLRPEDLISQGEVLYFQSLKASLTQRALGEYIIRLKEDPNALL